MLNGEHGQAYNAGNPACAISIGELADLLATLLPECNLQVVRMKQPDADYLSSPVSINIPDIKRLTGLGWQATHSLKDGFSRTIRYFAENPRSKAENS